MLSTLIGRIERESRPGIQMAVEAADSHPAHESRRLRFLALGIIPLSADSRR